jgi:hypothetical protein
MGVARGYVLSKYFAKNLAKDPFPEKCRRHRLSRHDPRSEPGLVGIQVNQYRLLDRKAVVGCDMNMEEGLLKTSKRRRRPKTENLHWQPSAAPFQLEAHDVFPDSGTLRGRGKRRAANPGIDEDHGGRKIKLTEQVVTTGTNF